MLAECPEGLISKDQIIKLNESTACILEESIVAR